MANFRKAYDYLMKDEGKVFENVPGDPGGATAYGLTHTDISRYLGRPVSISEMKAMTDDLAMEIYRKFYWGPLSLDRVNDDGVATCIFNQCVLRGLGYGKTIQRLIGVEADGHFGVKTIGTLNMWNPDDVIYAIEKDGERFYTNLAAQKPTLRKFLKGWMNRCRRLLGLIQK